MALRCRRRNSQQQQTKNHRHILYRKIMAPRSLEHKLQITMFRTRHSLAFLSRGILGCFISRLDCISSFCVVYSFTGILFTAFVGVMIKHQPLYIKGIDASNQELTKQNAFGAMGMFIFLFTSSAIYICFYKHRDDEHDLRSQGYMRPSAMSRLGSRDYHVELPHSLSSELHLQQDDSNDDDEVEADEMSSILS